MYKPYENNNIASNDTAYTRWSCHRCLANRWANCVDPPADISGGPIYRFCASRPWRPGMWLARLLMKAGNVETNPLWQPHANKSGFSISATDVRKQISIRYNRIEHWLHIIYADIRRAHYTDTRTCHLNKESRLTTHTDITPTHRPRSWPKPPTTPTHQSNPNTDTRPTLP